MLEFKIIQRGNGLLALQNMPSQLNKAMKNAQRDVMKHLRAELVRRTTTQYYITAARLRSAMRYTSSSILISGARQLIHHYKLSPSKRGKRRTRPLMAAVKKGPLKPLGGNTFLFPTSTGKQVAMRRLTRLRFPIEPVVSPAIPQLVSHPDILEGLDADVESMFNRRLEYWSLKAIGATK